jgi:hypothetical protein
MKLLLLFISGICIGIVGIEIPGPKLSVCVSSFAVAPRHVQQQKAT